jgi:hypothetical protein
MPIRITLETEIGNYPELWTVINNYNVKIKNIKEIWIENTLFGDCKKISKITEEYFNIDSLTREIESFIGSNYGINQKNITFSKKIKIKILSEKKIKKSISLIWNSNE